MRRCNGTWNPQHGAWQYFLELPAGSDGKRQRLRRGGFSSHDDAQRELDAVRGLLEIPDEDDGDAIAAVVDLIRASTREGGSLPTAEGVRRRLRSGQSLSNMPTLGEWLDRWLPTKKKIRKNTRVSYASHIRLYLKPHLGKIRIDRLRVEQVADLFEAIDDRNELIRQARSPAEIPKEADRETATKIRRKHQELQEKVRYQRVVGPASQQRIRATLRAALNSAISQQLITFNPAAHVELESGRSPKALVWTAERVARWQDMRQRPSTVMVWLPGHIGAFLDQVAGDRLYALYHLIAYRRLRRGEACGLHWDDIDVEAKTLTVRWQLLVIEWNTEQGEPKSEAGERIVALDDATVGALEAHRERQRNERTAAGSAWTDTGLVFTTELGQPLHPAAVSDHFRDLVAEAGLPPVRLHDLRHGAASLMRAAGADLKEVQETLGHEQYSTTADLYTNVFPRVHPRHGRGGRSPGAPRRSVQNCRPHLVHTRG